MEIQEFQQLLQNPQELERFGKYKRSQFSQKDIDKGILDKIKKINKFDAKTVIKILKEYSGMVIVELKKMMENGEELENFWDIANCQSQIDLLKIICNNFGKNGDKLLSLFNCENCGDFENCENGVDFENKSNMKVVEINNNEKKIDGMEIDEKEIDEKEIDAFEFN
jgi:hypothetical protein